MRLSITREHRLFYQNNHVIELEDLCTATQLQSIGTNIDNVLAERIGVKSRDINQQKDNILFASGRDLWRANPVLKKLATQPSFAEIAANLTEQHVLRLGYDQFFPSVVPSVHNILENSYADFLKKESTLEQASCLQGILCGLMICLKSPEHREEVLTDKTISTDLNLTNSIPKTLTALPTSPIQIFSKKAGNGIFFSPQAPICWQEMLLLQGRSYLLIVYTHAKPVYIYTEADPQVHALKQYGCSFGDRLSDKLNPLVHK